MFGQLVHSNYNIPIRKTSYHFSATLLYSQVNSITVLNYFPQIRNARKKSVERIQCIVVCSLTPGEDVFKFQCLMRNFWGHTRGIQRSPFDCTAAEEPHACGFNSWNVRGRGGRLITTGRPGELGQNKCEHNGGTMEIMVLLYVEDENFKLSLFFFPSSQSSFTVKRKKNN